MLINNLQRTGEDIEKRFLLQSYHDKAKDVIATDLVSACSMFKVDSIKRKVSAYLSHHDLDFNTGKKQIVSINDLLFEEITFQVFKNLEPNIYYESRGYMVTNSSTSKCFGIL